MTQINFRIHPRSRVYLAEAQRVQAQPHQPREIFPVSERSRAPGMPNQANEISRKGDNPDDILSDFQQSNPNESKPPGLVENICSSNSYRGRKYGFEK